MLDGQCQPSVAPGVSQHRLPPFPRAECGRVSAQPGEPADTPPQGEPLPQGCRGWVSAWDSGELHPSGVL